MSEEEYSKKLSELRSVKTAPVVMIKAADDANYKNLVDILDEMNINNIARYAIVDITPYDLGLIEKIDPAK
jgi:biopolymer transport protein ExbD